MKIFLNKRRLLFIMVISSIFVSINAKNVGDEVDNDPNNDEENVYIQVDPESISYNYYIGADDRFYYGEMSFIVHFPKGTKKIGYVKEKLREDLSIKWVPYSRQWYDIEETDSSLTITTIMKPILRIKFCTLINETIYYTQYINVSDYIADEDKQFSNRYVYDPDLVVSVKQIQENDEIKFNQVDDKIFVDLTEPSTISIYDLSGSKLFMSFFSDCHISIPVSKIGKGLHILNVESTSSSKSKKIFIK